MALKVVMPKSLGRATGFIREEDTGPELEKKLHEMYPTGWIVARCPDPACRCILLWDEDEVEEGAYEVKCPECARSARYAWLACGQCSTRLDRSASERSTRCWKCSARVRRPLIPERTKRFVLFGLVAAVLFPASTMLFMRGFSRLRQPPVVDPKSLEFLGPDAPRDLIYEKPLEAAVWASVPPPLVEAVKSGLGEGAFRELDRLARRYRVLEAPSLQDGARPAPEAACLFGALLGQAGFRLSARVTLLDDAEALMRLAVKLGGGVPGCPAGLVARTSLVVLLASSGRIEAARAEGRGTAEDIARFEEGRKDAPGGGASPPGRGGPDLDVLKRTLAQVAALTGGAAQPPR